MKMHYLTFDLYLGVKATHDLDLGVKATQKVALYPLHHVTYAYMHSLKMLRLTA